VRSLLRHPRRVLIAVAVPIALLAVLGLGLDGRLSPSSLDIPGTQASRAEALLRRHFGPSAPFPILLQGPPAALNRQGPDLVRALRRGDPRITTLSPWDRGSVSRLRPSPRKALIIADFHTEIGEAVKRIAGETSAAVTGIAGDVGNAAEVNRLVEQLGPVDILINNAGIFEPKPFLDVPDEDWLRFFEVNVMSGVRLSRALLPHMLKQNWGRIIFISSESGLNIPPEMVHYGMTKTAQLAISRGIAESVAGTGITVNAVLPGPTRTEGVVAFLEKMARERGVDVKAMEAEVIKTLRPSTLIKRWAEPEEVANPVVYLCSEAASATTGSALRVDGGVVRSIG